MGDVGTHRVISGDAAMPAALHVADRTTKQAEVIFLPVP
jgi:hypothetical protein